MTSSSADFGAVSYRTIDRQVQEDALLMTLDGTDNAGVSIASKSYFREDLSTSLDTQSVLSMLVKVEAKPTEPLLLSMNCEGTGDKPGSCHHSIDITQTINGIDKNSWQKLTVDLKCFSDQGTKFSQIVRPFELTSKGTLSIALANIQFEPNLADNATISCQ